MLPGDKPLNFPNMNGLEELRHPNLGNAKAGICLAQGTRPTACDWDSLLIGARIGDGFSINKEHALRPK